MRNQGTYYSLHCLLGHNPTVHGHVLATEFCPPPEILWWSPSHQCDGAVGSFFEMRTHLFISDGHWQWIKETSPCNCSPGNHECWGVAYRNMDMVSQRQLHCSKPLPKHGWWPMRAPNPEAPWTSSRQLSGQSPLSPGIATALIALRWHSQIFLPAHK